MITRQIFALKRLCLFILLLLSIELYPYVARNLLTIYFFDGVEEAQIEEMCWEYTWCSLTLVRNLSPFGTILFPYLGDNFWLLSFEQDIVENEYGPLYENTEHGLVLIYPHPFWTQINNEDIVWSVEPESERGFGYLSIRFVNGTEVNQLEEMLNRYTWCDMRPGSPLSTPLNRQYLLFDEDTVTAVIGDIYALMLQLLSEEIVNTVDFWRWDYSSTSDITLEKPNQYSIAYPNPSRAENITIKTNLYSPKMEISIFNVKGQLISRSQNFQTRNGESSINLNLQKEMGLKLVSGVYFYRITSDKEVQTGKFLVLK